MIHLQFGSVCLAVLEKKMTKIDSHIYENILGTVTDKLLGIRVLHINNTFSLR